MGFDATIPMQVFSSAHSTSGEALYEVAMVSVDGDSVMTTLGYELTPSHDASWLAGADTIIVPGTHNPAVRELGALDEATSAAFARIGSQARIVSICTGAFVLAAAGVFDGRRAATHWNAAAQLAALHPNITVDPSAPYVDEGTVMSSAGLDLCVHIIREDHGAQAATNVAREMVVAPFRDGNQSQFIGSSQNLVSGNDPIATAQAWARENLAGDVSGTELSRRAAMSPRSFARHFKSRVGVIPGEWVLRERVRLVQHLLESTALPVDAVAGRAGFGSGAALRARMRESLGVSPRSYRARFADR